MSRKNCEVECQIFEGEKEKPYEANRELIQSIILSFDSKWPGDFGAKFFYGLDRNKVAQLFSAFMDNWPSHNDKMITQFHNNYEYRYRLIHYKDFLKHIFVMKSQTAQDKVVKALLDNPESYSLISNNIDSLTDFCEKFPLHGLSVLDRVYSDYNLVPTSFHMDDGTIVFCADNREILDDTFVAALKKLWEPTLECARILVLRSTLEGSRSHYEAYVKIIKEAHPGLLSHPQEALEQKAEPTSEYFETVTEPTFHVDDDTDTPMKIAGKIGVFATQSVQSEVVLTPAVSVDTSAELILDPGFQGKNHSPR